jgi:hypothetical protein
VNGIAIALGFGAIAILLVSIACGKMLPRLGICKIHPTIESMNQCHCLPIRKSEDKYYELLQTVLAGERNAAQ